MKFDINKSIEILRRTPIVLDSLFAGLSDEWLKCNEGVDTWSPYDVLGHLIHGEKTDWIERSKIILSDLDDKTFIPFDRFAQLHNNLALPVENLLEEFKVLRANNIEKLISFQLNEATLLQSGIHPDLGVVSLKELLSTWVVHDLGHLNQISRVMATQYQAEVGPWINYLGVLNKK